MEERSVFQDCFLQKEEKLPRSSQMISLSISSARTGPQGPSSVREGGKGFLSFCTSGWERHGVGQQTGVTRGPVVMAGGYRGNTANSRWGLSKETEPELLSFAPDSASPQWFFNRRRIPGIMDIWYCLTSSPYGSIITFLCMLGSGINGPQSAPLS